MTSKDFNVETDLTDAQRKLFHEYFNPDGSQKKLLVHETRSVYGNGRSTPESNNAYKLLQGGLLEREPYKYKKRVFDRRTRETRIEDAEARGYRVKPEFCYLVTEPLPVTITEAQEKILDFIEGNGNGPFTAKEMTSDRYGTEDRQIRTGMTAPSISSNCKKLVTAGLLTQGKKGRATAWTRTKMPRPESAEERKRRLEENRLEELRKKGLAHICQGCLRVILINETGSFGQQDKVCRHGWQVIGGGRGYGHYGSMHTEGCRGWNNLPLEKGYDIAEGIMIALTKAVPESIKELARLKAKPTFKTTRGAWEHWSKQDIEEKAEEAKETIEVKPGDEFKKYGSVYSSYDKMLKAAISQERMYLGALASDCDLFSRRVGDFWADECKDIIALAKARAKEARKALEAK